MPKKSITNYIVYTLLSIYTRFRARVLIKRNSDSITKNITQWRRIAVTPTRAKKRLL